LLLLIGDFAKEWPTHSCPPKILLKNFYKKEEKDFDKNDDLSESETEFFRHNLDDDNETDLNKQNVCIRPDIENMYP
jgi:hypothetical protein